jgi:hypothetical protein
VRTRLVTSTPATMGRVSSRSLIVTFEWRHQFRGFGVLVLVPAPRTELYDADTQGLQPVADYARRHALAQDFNNEANTPVIRK